MMELAQWWNLPFTVPFVLAALYLALAAFGLASADSAAAPEASGVEAADAAPVADGTGPAAVAGDPDHAGTVADAPGGSNESSFGRLLDALGLGRVPLTIVLQVFFLVWGFTGWAANLLLAPVLREPLLFFWPSLLIAFVVATTLTVLLARPLARWMPATESYSPTKRRLVGRIGIAVFPITVGSGMVHLRDTRGNLHQLACRTAEVETTIEKGAEVIVYGYDESSGRYLVTRSDLPTLPAGAKGY